jgi:predicted enzyme related to lactoylglutathione lyase
MLQNLSTLLVYVHDMPRCVAFYRDTLGLPLKLESPEWSEFELGSGVALGLHKARTGMASAAPGWVPSFRVVDIKAARERITDSGSGTAMEFHDIPGGVVMDVKDPDGNTLSLEQRGVSCADLGV